MGWSALISRFLVVVPSTANLPPCGSEKQKNQSNHCHDNPNRPQNRNLGDEADQHQDYSKDDHISPLLGEVWLQGSTPAPRSQTHLCRSSPVTQLDVGLTSLTDESHHIGLARNGGGRSGLVDRRLEGGPPVEASSDSAKRNFRLMRLSSRRGWCVQIELSSSGPEAYT